jgi:hypothetical protein
MTRRWNLWTGKQSSELKLNKNTRAKLSANKRATQSQKISLHLEEYQEKVDL